MNNSIKLNLEMLTALALEKGASNTAKIEVKDINFNENFRDICETKTCGAYGRSWMCPPNVDCITKLIAHVKQYQSGFVFQTITQLEDSFDIEGMLAAGKNINELARFLKNSDAAKKLGEILVIGGGGCGYCEKCSFETSKPCVFPDMAISSIEAYGIDAMSLTRATKLEYNNGKNTVTYYGVILFNETH